MITGRAGRALHRVGYYRTGVEIEGSCAFGYTRNLFGYGRIVGVPGGGINLLEEQRVLASIGSPRTSAAVRELQLKAFLDDRMTFVHVPLPEVKTAFQGASDPKISPPALLPLIKQALAKLESMLAAQPAPAPAPGEDLFAVPPPRAVTASSSITLHPSDLEEVPPGPEGTPVSPASFNPEAATTHAVEGKHPYALYPDVDYTPFATGAAFSWLDQLALHRTNLETSLTAMLAAIKALNSQQQNAGLWLEAVMRKIAETQKPYQNQIEAMGKIRAAMTEFLTSIKRAESDANQKTDAIREEEMPAAGLRSEQLRLRVERERRIREIEDALTQKIIRLEEKAERTIREQAESLAAPFDVRRLLTAGDEEVDPLIAERISSLEGELQQKLAETVPLTRSGTTERRTVVVLHSEKERLEAELPRLEEVLAQVEGHRQTTLAQLEALRQAASTLQSESSRLLGPLTASVPQNLQGG